MDTFEGQHVQAGSMSEGELVRVTIDAWHPACWTLEATAGRDGGILGHGTTRTTRGAIGRYTVFGRSSEVVEDLFEAIEDADRVDRVGTVGRCPGGVAGRQGLDASTAVIAFKPGNGVREPLTGVGLLHEGPSRHEGGRERRTLLGWGERSDVIDRLVSTMERSGGEVEIVAIDAIGNVGSGTSTPTWELDGIDGLTRRQREVLELARRRGYYRYPRETSPAALADELGLATSTVIEHLRRAESRLLDDAPHE